MPFHLRQFYTYALKSTLFLDFRQARASGALTSKTLELTVDVHTEIGSEWLTYNKNRKCVALI